MKIDKYSFKYLLALVSFAIVLTTIMMNFSTFWNFLLSVFSVLMPLIIGFFMAFIINLPMRQFERLFSRAKKKWILALKRPISFFLSVISILAILTIVVSLIVPEIAKAVVVLVEYIPKAIDISVNWLKENNHPFLMISDYLSSLKIDWVKIAQQALGVATGTLTDLFSASVGLVTSFVGGLINFGIGFIISIYILFSKEKLKLQVKKLIYAYTPKKFSSYLLHILYISKNTFAKYIVGQCTEAAILGTLCVLGMTVLGLPYALMIGAMIGVLALIPIVGLCIAVALGTFMIIMVNPMQAIIFLVFYCILQQIEGNLIYPKVVGSSIGLEPIWVLTAIIAGGGLFGIIGLIFAVPTASVVITLIKESANNRLSNKYSRSKSAIEVKK